MLQGYCHGEAIPKDTVPITAGKMLKLQLQRRRMGTGGDQLCILPKIYISRRYPATKFDHAGHG